MARIDTQLIHAGEPRPGIEGAVSVPVFHSAMFAYDPETTDYNALRYLRLNNSPNHLALHAKLAALEQAEAALVTSSGMSAISTAMLALLEPGDHLLAQACLYGATHDLFTKELPRLGIQTDFLHEDPACWPDQVRSNTRAVYTEALSNPTLRVIDHRAIVQLAQEHRLISMIDNTFATPFNFRPIAMGYDLAFHSCTKYLNGHSDLVAGAVVGSQVLVDKVKVKLNHLGGCLDPGACFLLHRGMKTLAVRLRHQNQSTQRIAEFLAAHPLVLRVEYPGLPDHPDHARAREFFEGCAGVLSFELDHRINPLDFISYAELPIHTFSLGGVETLMIQPSRTSHSGLSPQEREALGITAGLIRMSVGLEDTDDLIADLTQALERAVVRAR